VADGAIVFRNLSLEARPMLLNGDPGFVVSNPRGRPISVVCFAVSGGKIVEIDVLADPERLRRLELPALA
jgi:RNA polymerase sigma-70 factor (ECF subfamily)